VDAKIERLRRELNLTDEQYEAMLAQHGGTRG
jgi:hypothetical protein